MRLQFAIAALLGAVVICAATAASRQQAGCQGAATPRQTLRQFMAAATHGDWSSAFENIDRKARAKLFEPFLVKLILGLHVKWAWDTGETEVAANAKVLDELAKVLRDNGFRVDQNNRYPDLENDIEGVTNWPKLMHDIAEFAKVHLDREMFWPKTEIGPVKVSGNKADAQLIHARGGIDRVRLSKRDDIWCISRGFEGRQ